MSSKDNNGFDYDEYFDQPQTSSCSSINLIDASNLASQQNVNKNVEKFSNRFPESEFDVLEKKLLSIEYHLHIITQAENSKKFKQLCTLAVVFEDEWVRLFCEHDSLILDDNREYALHVLKYNLDIRRDGLRPTLKVDKKLQKTRRTIESSVYKTNDLSEGTSFDVESEDVNVSTDRYLIEPELYCKNSSKREPRMTTTAIKIATGNDIQQNDFSNNAKMCYGMCVPISSLAESPEFKYSTSSTIDPCFQLENQLFDIECKLKKFVDNKLNFNNPEYKKLVEEGQKIRKQWKLHFSKNQQNETL